MTDSLSYDARLRATEAQMRRALGLHGDGAPQPTSTAPAPTPTMGLHPQRRRFVRDGEVVVQHKEHSATGETGTNQLAAARQALRYETTAREDAERALDMHRRWSGTSRQSWRMSGSPGTRQSTAPRQPAWPPSSHFRLCARNSKPNAPAGFRRRKKPPLPPGGTANPRGRPIFSKPPQCRAGAAARQRSVSRNPWPSPTAGEEQSDFVEWRVPGWQDRFR